MVCNLIFLPRSGHTLRRCTRVHGMTFCTYQSYLPPLMKQFPLVITQKTLFHALYGVPVHERHRCFHCVLPLCRKNRRFAPGRYKIVLMSLSLTCFPILPISRTEALKIQIFLKTSQKIIKNILIHQISHFRAKENLSQLGTDFFSKCESKSAVYLLFFANSQELRHISSTVWVASHPSSSFALVASAQNAGKSPSRRGPIT